MKIPQTPQNGALPDFGNKIHAKIHFPVDRVLDAA